MQSQENCGIKDKFAQLEQKCDAALQHIEVQNYEAELVEDCYQNILQYGVAFYGKTFQVKMGNVRSYGIKSTEILIYFD